MSPDVAAATRLFRDARVPSPEYDARALAEYATATGADFDALVARRAAREPLQHLLGTAGFRYLELAVGPGVFVPRPETEVLVEAVLKEVDDSSVVVDLCAGSGTIGLSIAHERPGVVVHLVERDPSAYEWLQRNAAGYDVHLYLADASEALREIDGAVDVVASNPPYVAEHERAMVDPEVRDHDPEDALFAGTDGMDVIRIVATRAWDLLKPGGLVAIEHSDRQGETVPALLRDRGWAEVEDHLDLTGRPRFTTGRKP